MKHYIVVSPEFGMIVPVIAGDGPTEHGCSVVSVEANSKREAKSKALRSVDFADWVDRQRSDGKNPFAGLEVVDPVCGHGHCYCNLCGGEFCQECLEDVEKESE